MIWEAIKQAVEMLTTDSGVWIIILRSLEVSGVAVLSAALIGIPLGLLVGLVRFPGRSAAVSVVNTGMALPPVVVGLLVFLLLSRTGPLGSFQLLYTKQAMMTAQLIMAVPLILGITVAGISGVSKELLLQARSLGAGRMQIAVLALREARLVLVMALVAGMGRVIAEVGAVMMVGGNIEGNTQVMTTAIMEEVRKGNYSVGLALGVILLGIALAANAFMSRLQVKETAA